VRNGYRERRNAPASLLVLRLDRLLQHHRHDAVAGGGHVLRPVGRLVRLGDAEGQRLAVQFVHAEHVRAARPARLGEVHVRPVQFHGQRVFLLAVGRDGDQLAVAEDERLAVLLRLRQLLAGDRQGDEGVLAF